MRGSYVKTSVSSRHGVATDCDFYMCAIWSEVCKMLIFWIVALCFIIEEKRIFVAEKLVAYSVSLVNYQSTKNQIVIMCYPYIEV